MNSVQLAIREEFRTMDLLVALAFSFTMSLYLTLFLVDLFEMNENQVFRDVVDEEELGYEMIDDSCEYDTSSSDDEDDSSMEFEDDGLMPVWKHPDEILEEEIRSMEAIQDFRRMTRRRPHLMKTGRKMYSADDMDTRPVKQGRWKKIHGCMNRPGYLSVPDELSEAELMGFVML